MEWEEKEEIIKFSIINKKKGMLTINDMKWWMNERLTTNDDDDDDDDDTIF